MPPTSGQEIHQTIQRQRLKTVPGYVAEKKISREFTQGPYKFEISGRVDGFIPQPLMIEEIKSAFDVDDLLRKLEGDTDHPYFWQLRTYGYFHYKETGDIPVLRLHLVSARNFKTRDIDFVLDVDSYERWLTLRLAELEKETEQKEKTFKRRQKIAAEMQFPFSSPRPGQKELVATIEENFSKGIPLMLQAPTGLGKTVGILFPSLKEALPRGQKVVYVTPKNSQHQVAEEAVEMMQEQGSKLRALTINAKSKMCLKAEPLCNPRYCEYAKDYYKKVAENDLVNKLGKLKNLSREKLQSMGEEFQVCPFELSVEAIERADVVIADYNYVFAPRSLLGRLAAPLLEPSEKPNLAIDEAHNLPSRAQDYFSPSISTQSLGMLEKDFIKLPSSFSFSAPVVAQRARRLIQSYGKEGYSKIIDIDLDPFLEIEKDIRDLTTEYLESDAEILPQDPLLRFMNMWSDFVAALSHSGKE
ncbi:MAG TPA: DEAD/DEAH box helicase, partial [Bdellovibrio sp.]